MTDAKNRSAYTISIYGKHVCCQLGAFVIDFGGGLKKLAPKKASPA